MQEDALVHWGQVDRGKCRANSESTWSTGWHGNLSETKCLAQAISKARTHPVLRINFEQPSLMAASNRVLWPLGGVVLTGASAWLTADALNEAVM